MKLVRKKVVLCIILIFTLCLLSGTAYAVEETEEPTETEDIIDIVGEYILPIVEEIVPVYEIEPETPAEDLFTIPDGTGTVIETATGEDGKVFYTISTPAGNIFYLIIDHSRQANNVFFLNAVTERDLLALAERSDDWNVGVSAIPEIENIPHVPEHPPDNQIMPEQESNDTSLSGIVLIVAMVIIGIGAGVYFYRKSKNNDSNNEYESDLQSYDEYEDSYSDSEQDDDDMKLWGDK